MISKRSFLAGLAAALPLAAAAAESTEVVIGYLDRADDPGYAVRHSYETIRAASVPSPFPGAALAVSDARLIGDAAGLAFKLERATLEDGEDAAKAARALASAKHAAAIILDLPLDETGRHSFPRFCC